MSIEAIVETIVTFVRDHQSWAAPVAFLVAFAESFCFLSIFWPGTAILVGITALLAAGGVDKSILLPAIIAAGLGGTVGYAVSYWIGRYFKDSIANVWPFSSRPDLIPHGKSFFEKWGVWGVFFGHFFGPVRAVIPVVAGIFDMRQLPFQIANTASAFMWAAGVIAPSFFLVTFKAEIFAFLREHELIVAAFMALVAYLNSIPTPLMAIPTLILFVGTGALHLFAGGHPIAIFLAGAAGAFAGDLHAYFTGRQRPRDFHAIWPNSWSPEAADDARAFVAKWGLPGIVMSKFHTTRRAFAPLAAGAASIALPSFLAVSLASSLLWAGVLLSPRFVLQLIGW